MGALPDLGRIIASGFGLPLANKRPGGLPPLLVIEVRELAPGIPVRVLDPLRLPLAQLPQLGLLGVPALTRLLASLAFLLLFLFRHFPGGAEGLARRRLAFLLGLLLVGFRPGPRAAALVHLLHACGHLVVEIVLAGPVPRPARKAPLQEPGLPAGLAVDVHVVVAAAVKPHLAGALAVDDLDHRLTLVAELLLAGPQEGRAVHDAVV